MITPDYRKTPESSGLDILADVSDFWTWAHGGELAAGVAAHYPDITLDLAKVVAAGESAGQSFFPIRGSYSDTESSEKAVTYPSNPPSSFPTPKSQP